jgi:hypothetical protein
MVDGFNRVFSVVTDHPNEAQKLGRIPAVQSLRRVGSAFKVEVGAIIS